MWERQGGGGGLHIDSQRPRVITTTTAITPRHATPLALKHSYATRELVWHLEKMTDFDSEGHRSSAVDLTTARKLGMYFVIIISRVRVEGHEFNPAHVLLIN